MTYHPEVLPLLYLTVGFILFCAIFVGYGFWYMRYLRNSGKKVVSLDSKDSSVLPTRFTVANGQKVRVFIDYKMTGLGFREVVLKVKLKNTQTNEIAEQTDTINNRRSAFRIGLRTFTLLTQGTRAFTFKNLSGEYEFDGRELFADSNIKKVDVAISGYDSSVLKYQ